MKKCLLFVLLFVASSIALFTGTSVSAASPYDDVIATKTEPFELFCSSPSNPSPGNFLKIGETLGNHADDFPEVQTALDIIAGDTNGTLTINGGNFQSSGAFEFINIFYTQSTSATASFKTGSNGVRYISHDQTMYQIQILANSGVVGGQWACLDDSWVIYGVHAVPGGQTTFASINNDGFHRERLILSVNTNIQYPEDYEGDNYNNFEGNLTGDGHAHKPNITWQVNDKDVTVHSDSTKNTADLSEYQIYWFVSNTTTNTKQPDEPFALSGCTPADYNNSFTVTDYIDYGIQAYYADMDCNIITSDDAGSVLTDNMVVITVDGSTFDGSTTDHEAIIGDIEESPIMKAIRKFKPEDGGLASLIFAPIYYVATLPTAIGSCTPINLPIIGENVPLKCVRPTLMSSPVAPVIATLQVIATGLVTWWIAWRTFRKIKELQDPQDDRVEVLNL